jgi:hypothetical protein
MVDDRAVHAGPRGAAAASLELCQRFVGLLPVTGASISVTSASGAQSTIGITDSVAAELEQLQFELGAGPHWDVLKTGLAVFVPDTRALVTARWPMFGSAIANLPVGAVFALPMRMGAVTVGVVDLYRSTPGELRGPDVGAALSLASSIAEQALRYAVVSADDDAGVETVMAPAMRREIHQATGMIFIQLGVSATEAFTRLQARAFADGRPVADIAHDVVNRSLAFTHDDR